MYPKKPLSQLLLQFASDPRCTQAGSAGTRPDSKSEAEAYDLSHFFVVDSFNIHRLVIAGVTCASKFFSDVFYTNSRYAKVSSYFSKTVSPIHIQADPCSRWAVCLS